MQGISKVPVTIWPRAAERSIEKIRFIIVAIRPARGRSKEASILKNRWRRIERLVDRELCGW
ncbi:MAG TPA: hypothetical protein VHD36_19090 [Pirellulales bacterium]|nr:hypothetical protein [Pirellulales bacterium]